jgi:hypothetical protein
MVNLGLRHDERTNGLHFTGLHLLALQMSPGISLTRKLMLIKLMQAAGQHYTLLVGISINKSWIGVSDMLFA